MNPLNVLQELYWEVFFNEKNEDRRNLAEAIIWNTMYHLDYEHNNGNYRVPSFHKEWAINKSNIEIPS